MLEEYADVLGDRPDFVAEIVGACQLCHPLTELRIIRHEPDNRFLECAFAASADFIVTVNTARGHFDENMYQSVGVVTPGQYLKLREELFASETVESLYQVASADGQKK